MSRWYVIVDPAGRYRPLLRDERPWVSEVNKAEVFTSLGKAKQALQGHIKINPNCRIERLPRLPDRVPRR
jgi:hypothetical protein